MDMAARGGGEQNPDTARPRPSTTARKLHIAAQPHHRGINCVPHPSHLPPLPPLRVTPADDQQQRQPVRLHVISASPAEVITSKQCYEQSPCHSAPVCPAREAADDLRDESAAPRVGVCGHVGPLPVKSRACVEADPEADPVADPVATSYRETMLGKSSATEGKCACRRTPWLSRLPPDQNSGEQSLRAGGAYEDIPVAVEISGVGAHAMFRPGPDDVGEL